jgi:hypothetical protein
VVFRLVVVERAVVGTVAEIVEPIVTVGVLASLGGVQGEEVYECMVYECMVYECIM